MAGRHGAGAGKTRAAHAAREQGDVLHVRSSAGGGESRFRTRTRYTYYQVYIHIHIYIYMYIYIYTSIIKKKLVLALEVGRVGLTP